MSGSSHANDDQEGVAAAAHGAAAGAFILATLERYGLPKNEEQAMQLARLAYGQGYTDGLHDREEES